LTVIAIVSLLLYWPLVWLIVESIADRRALWRECTGRRALTAVGAGFVAALASFLLTAWAPSVFGILSLPAGYISMPVMMFLSPGKGFLVLQLASGCTAYSAIALMVLHRWVWRKSSTTPGLFRALSN
jgi:hypothetical protein